jgi:hypothetical protein
MHMPLGTFLSSSTGLSFKFINLRFMSGTYCLGSTVPSSSLVVRARCSVNRGVPLSHSRARRGGRHQPPPACRAVSFQTSAHWQAPWPGASGLVAQSQGVAHRRQPAQPRPGTTRRESASETMRVTSLAEVGMSVRSLRFLRARHRSAPLMRR